MTYQLICNMNISVDAVKDVLMNLLEVISEQDNRIAILEGSKAASEAGGDSSSTNETEQTN